MSDLKANKIETADEEDNRYFALTDRRIYLPGQTVRFWGWLRDREVAPEGLRYSPVREESVKLVLVGPRASPSG